VYVASWCRLPAILPPPPLAWLAIGQSDLYPTAYFGPEYDEVSQIANPLKLLAGHWDLGFTTVYLLPLFILALSFDLVASDRESGILQITLSQPVRARTILLARATTVALIVFGAVAIVYIVGVATSGVDFQDGMTARALLAGVAIIVYAAFWLALAVGLNALGRSATDNALALATLWLCFVVLLPFAIDQIATKIHPRCRIRKSRMSRDRRLKWSAVWAANGSLRDFWRNTRRFT
jgi:ABC-2 type transport system permease protein